MFPDPAKQKAMRDGLGDYADRLSLINHWMRKTGGSVDDFYAHFGKNPPWKKLADEQRAVAKAAEHAASRYRKAWTDPIANKDKHLGMDKAQKAVGASTGAIKKDQQALLDAITDKTGKAKDRGKANFDAFHASATGKSKSLADRVIKDFDRMLSGSIDKNRSLADSLRNIWSGIASSIGDFTDAITHDILSIPDKPSGGGKGGGKQRNLMGDMLRAAGSGLAALTERLESLGSIIGLLGSTAKATPEELTSLQGALTSAQGALPDARMDAERALVDMRFNAAEAAAAQTNAEKALADAQKNAARFGTSTSPAAIEARAAVVDAELDLAQARESNSRAQHDLSAAEARGVEGAPGVVAAKQAITDAQDALTAAQAQGTDAVSQLTEALKGQQVQMLQNLATAQGSEKARLEGLIGATQAKLDSKKFTKNLNAKEKEQREKLRKTLAKAKADLEALVGVTGGGGAFAQTIQQLLGLGALSPQQALDALGLPSFDRGGTVPGPIGQPQVIVAHGGEEVVPRDKWRSDGPLVNIEHFHGESVDERAIANHLAWRIATG